MAAVIRVAVLDDHPVVAEGIAARLGREADVLVIAQVRSVGALLATLDATPTDVILCDVMLCDAPTGLDVPELVAERIGPRPPVLFLSSYDTSWFQRTAVARGAAGYLLKTASVGEIVRGIRAVASGDTVYAARMLRPGVSPRVPSARERDVIRLVSGGAGNGEVARALGITTKTVESHLSRLYARYGVANRTELAIVAVRERWLPASSSG
jgi:DNA-binding NarL/FixJ family response regulator